MTPHGYAGVNHQTLGSDILSVLGTLKAPQEVLGAELHERLRQLDPAGWYPVEELLRLLDTLEARGGRASLVKMGRQLFQGSHAARVTPQLRSARDVIYGIGQWYRHANRGDGIGGWTVVSFAPGAAVLEKNTPHRCALEEGILVEALHVVGTDALVVQSQCVESGAPCCRFEVHSAVRDARWTGQG